MPAKEKRFTIKFYEPDGTTLLKTFDAESFRSSPSFNSQINGGFGECSIDLNLPFDDFGEGTTVDFMNVVKIFQSDEDNTTGRLIYTGFISGYTPFLKSADQGVSVRLLGLVSLLSFAYYKDADFEVPHVGVDPSEIMKDIIDNFATVNTKGLIGYDGSGTTIDSVGTNVDYTFTEKTWLNAIKDIFGTVGAGWWWAIDKEGQLYLKEKPTSATHAFTIGKDVEELKIEKSSEDVVNAVRVKYGASTQDDSDATSISSFEKREKIVTDSQIGDATTATQRAEQEVDDNKSEKIKATLIINSQYDIESVKVGDTCEIRNLAIGSTLFTDNMQIVKIKYEWDQIELQLEEITDDFGTELNKFVNP